jgi:hypothetical protein
MYLSTITAKDASPKSKLFPKPTSSYLETSDIIGARPSLKGYEYFNKPCLAYTTQDIEKASPKPLHQKLSKPESNLQTRDIDGAFPMKTGFQTRRIGTNPLNPVYDLPKYEVYASPPPKFIRDQINVSDIEGTKPEIYYKWGTRNTMNIEDIEGSSAKPVGVLNKPNLMDPRDINKGESKVYSRSTNPLQPEYLTKDKEGQTIIIGPVEGSRPSVAIKTSQPAHSRHLDNSDIEGSGPSTKGLGPVGRKTRNYEKALVNTEDIAGARAGSLAKGISTMRQTNPLDPSYKWQTEDPSPIKPVNKPAPPDEQYVKNTGKFFGLSENNSTSKSPPRSQSSSRVSSFRVNANKFYAEDPGQGLSSKVFEKNAENFFENKGKGLGLKFDNVRNPGSINRPKPKTTIVDVESAEYQRNLNKFYTDQSRPQSFSGLSASSGKSIQSAKSIVSRNVEGGKDQQYQFGLSRAEIGNPPVESRLKDPPSRASEIKSQKSLLSSAAKHQLGC